MDALLRKMLGVSDDDAPRAKNPAREQAGRPSVMNPR
jgi:hypothetical protein